MTRYDEDDTVRPRPDDAPPAPADSGPQDDHPEGDTDA